MVTPSQALYSLGISEVSLKNNEEIMQHDTIRYHPFSSTETSRAAQHQRTIRVGLGRQWKAAPLSSQNVKLLPWQASLFAGGKIQGIDEVSERTGPAQRLWARQHG